MWNYYTDHFVFFAENRRDGMQTAEEAPGAVIVGGIVENGKLDFLEMKTLLKLTKMTSQSLNTRVKPCFAN